MVVSERSAIVFKKKIVLSGCHTDVFLKTACFEACLIELIEDLGNEGNRR